MLLGITFQNRAFFPQKLVCQTPLKYEKELFDQVNKLKANFFGVPNTHIILNYFLNSKLINYYEANFFIECETKEMDTNFFQNQ